MSISQKQIAETLNLSAGTVSRCLSGHPDILPQTRKKVIALASELGYRPSGYSRHGKHGKTDSGTLVSFGVAVAVLPDDPGRKNPTAPAYHILAGISSAAQKEDISLVTHFVPFEQCRKMKEPEFQFPALRKGVLSGMILVYDWPDETLRKFSKLLPCVTIVNPHQDLGIDCVGDDFSGGIEKVVHHLYDLGHRQIGFVSNQTGGSWLAPRFAGYMQALRRLGLTCDPSITINVFNPTLDENAQADAIAEHRKNGITAWVCAGDDVAYHLYPLLIARGLKVPQDVSITGFDGLTPPPRCPHVTSIHQPFERMGAAAVRRLFYRMKHPDEPLCHTQFSGEFVKGETTAPPNVEYRTEQIQEKAHSSGKEKTIDEMYEVD
ncbi:MAG: LacI family transcriptional regulator [Phycisphaerae bacterium]|nr:LacI family transcriptional regulator [Phycisphaerae bacterium]